MDAAKAATSAMPTYSVQRVGIETVSWKFLEGWLSSGSLLERKVGDSEPHKINYILSTSFFGAFFWIVQSSTSFTNCCADQWLARASLYTEWTLLLKAMPFRS
jgi:hypothetical protein